MVDFNDLIPAKGSSKAVTFDDLIPEGQTSTTGSGGRLEARRRAEAERVEAERIEAERIAAELARAADVAADAADAAAVRAESISAPRSGRDRQQDAARARSPQEPAAQAPEVAAPTEPRGPDPRDTTDDARADRGFGRTAYMNGLAGPMMGVPKRATEAAPAAVTPNLPPIEANPDGTAAGRAFQRGALRTASSLPFGLAVADATAISDARKSDADISAQVFREVTGQWPTRGQDLSTPEKTAAAISQMGLPADRPVLYRELYERRIANAAEAREKPEVFQQRGVQNLQAAEGLTQRAADLPKSPAGQRMERVFAETEDTFLDTIKIIAKNPLDFTSFIAETAAESGVQLTATAAASLLTRSPSAVALATGAGSMAQEYGSSVSEFLQENQIRLETEADAEALLNNPEMLQAASDRGVGRGLVISAFEMLGQGVAAKQLFQSPIGDALAQTFIQGATGSAGEASARAATGQEQSAREILLEGLAELVTAPIEVGAAAYAGRDGGGPSTSSSAPVPPTAPDTQRLTSPRLTAQDRSSPIPNDVIDDGKALMEDVITNGSGLGGAMGRTPPALATPAAPDAPMASPRGPAPELPVDRPRPPPLPEVAPRAPAADVTAVPPVRSDLPYGAVPMSDLYGEEYVDPDAEPVADETPAAPARPDDYWTKANEENAKAEEANQPAPVAEPTKPAVIEGVPPAEVAQANEAARDKFQIANLTSEEVAQIDTDARTFQYKDDGDQQGVTTALQGTTGWDQRSATGAIIYEYADGRRVVADGHQRLGLAKRLQAQGQRTPWTVEIIRESDGFTPEDVRTLAALKNIRQGSGTAIDAAKVLRENPDQIESLNLPPSSALVRNSKGLARLSDDAFGMAVNKVIKPEWAAIVGSKVPDQSAQGPIIGLLKTLEPRIRNLSEVESIVGQAQQTAATETQTDMFGETEVTANRYLERAKIIDATMSRLKLKGKVFKALLDKSDLIETAGNTLNQTANAAIVDDATRVASYIRSQANMKGPVSDALTAAANQLAENPKAIGEAVKTFLGALDGPTQENATGTESSGAGTGNQGSGLQRPVSPTQEVTPANPETDMFGDPIPTGPAAEETTKADGGMFGDLPTDDGGKGARDRDEVTVRSNQSKSGRLEGNTGDAGPMFDTQSDSGVDKPDPQKPIGNNADGNPVYEDANGVRSYVESGVRVKETVSVTPTRTGVNTGKTARPRSSEFLTESEVDALADESNAPAAPKPSPDNRPDTADTPLDLTEDLTGSAKQGVVNGVIYRIADDMGSVGLEGKGKRVIVTRQSPYKVSDIKRTDPNEKPWDAPRAVDEALRRAFPDEMAKTDEAAAPAKRPAAAPTDAAPAKRPSGLSPEKQARLEELNASIAAKLRNQLNSGLDPQLVAMAIESATLYVEGGVRRFRDYATNMLQATGLKLPILSRYLRMAYNDVRDELEANGEAVSDMDSSAEVIKELARMTREAQETESSTDSETEVSWGEAEIGDRLRGPGDKPKYKVRGKIKKWEADGLARKVGGYITLDGDVYGVVGPKSLNASEVRTLLDEVRQERDTDATPAKAGPAGDDTDALTTPAEDDNTLVGKLRTAMQGDTVTHTTAKGKELTGYVLDVTKTEGNVVDAYSFKKGDGVFIRKAAAEKFMADTAPAETGTGSKPFWQTSVFKTRLVKGFAADFAKGTDFPTIIAARKAVETHTGQAYEPEMSKTVEEAIELATVIQARAIVDASSDMTEGQVYQRMVDLYVQQPTLSQRTSTSVEMQAYSTPAPLAYLASRLAGIDSKSRVYEPSAGNGMLLMEAEPANIQANELQPDRVDGLRRALGDEATITEGDATKAKPGPYDTLITNPPFGKVRNDMGETVTFDLRGLGEVATTTEIDHAISAMGLDALPTDGRAVLIIGGQKGTTQEQRRQEYVKGSTRKFFKALYDNYNVTEHFTAAGSLYQKQGAGWPVDVIVIEGKGRSAKPYPMKTAPAIYPTWGELGGRLNGRTDSLDPRTGDAGSRDGDTGSTSTPADDGSIPGRAGVADQSNGQTGGAGSSAGSAGSGGAGRRPVGNARPVAGGGRDGVRVGNTDGSVRDAGDAVADTSQPDQAGGRADTGTGGRNQPDGISGPRVSPDRVNEEVETSFQVQYDPRSAAQFAVGTLVPKNMQQAMTRALDAVEASVGNIDTYVANKLGYSIDEMLGTPENGGYFSAEQMDALALAIFNVEQGKAFIIGDQTGVGKGRFVAAMLRFASRNGMAPVFVTKDPGLYADMIRDMRDIGMAEAHTKALVTNGDLRGKDVLPLSDKEGDTLASLSAKQLKSAMETILKTGKLPKGMDFLFTTYSQMQQYRGQTTTRMNALEAIAPNAMFVLDESHEAGGGAAPDRAAKEDGEAKIPRSVFIRSLLADSQGAVFSSATYAKNPSVMSLYAKTDLSLAVDKIDDLEPMITAGGVPLQQVIANMLVESGQYARRERSYEGVEMGMKQLVTDREMAARGAAVIRALFNLDTQVMQDVRENFITNAEGEGMAGVVDTSVGNAGMSSTNFASTMHNLAAQFLLAIKVDAVIEDAKARAAEGKKVIIALSNTNASIIKEAADEAGVTTGQGLNVPFNKILLRYLERLRRITIKDEADNSSYVYLTDAQIAEYGGQESLDAFNEAKRFIEKSDLAGLPGSPIDAILDGLTAANIDAGEITGRNVTLRNNILESRDSSAAAKKRVMNDFNKGALNALVINRSGSTGFSMHATDKPGNDGKPRHMIILQPEPNIDLFMQMLGRIHRTGQIKLPSYTIAVSDLSVEKRPAAVLMRKMASLNANTTASKKSAISLDNVVDFLNAYGDQVVSEYLRENPSLALQLDIAPPTKERSDGIAAKFTGRLVSIDPDEVTRIYGDIESAYTDFIDALDRMGMNALEAKVLELDAKTISETEIVSASDDRSPFGEAAYVQAFDVKRLGKPYSPAQLDEEIEAATNGEDAGSVVADQVAELRGLLGGEEKKLTDRLEAARGNLVAAKTDKQKEAAQQRYRSATDAIGNLNERFAMIAAMMESLAAGRAGILSSGEGDAMQSFGAVSLGINISRVTGNPTAASNIKVRIAIADAGRELTLHIGKFMADGGYTWREVPSRQRGSVIEAFANGQSESRENRQMITGNIPAGFAQFKRGQIVIYTDQDGTMKQGVLLPANFEAGAALQNRPVKMVPAQVAEFLTADGIGARVVQTDDGVASVSYNGTDFSILVKKQGHKKYTLNRSVRAIAGEFANRGGGKFWRLNVRDRNALVEALDVYAENLGVEYSTTIDRDAARAITGEVIPDVADPNADPDQARFSRAYDVSSTVDPDMTATQTTPAKFLAEGKITAYTTPEVQAEAKKLAADMNKELSRLGLPMVKTTVVENAFGNADDGSQFQINGAYFKGLVYLAMKGIDSPMVKTVRHEAIHALRNADAWGKEFGLFRPAEWKALEAMARADVVAMAEAREFYPDETEAAQIEEVIAAKFADYAAGEWKPKNFVGSAMKRIGQALEAIRNAMQGNGFRTTESVFAKALSGEVGSRRNEGKPRTEPKAPSRISASANKRQARTDRQVSGFVGAPVTSAVMHDTPIDQRKDTFLKAVMTQPLDAAFRIPFMMVGGIDKYGRWTYGKAAHAKLSEAITSKDMGFMQPLAEVLRNGLVDRAGQPKDYIERDRQRGVDEALLAAEGNEHVRALMDRQMDAKEARVLQAVLTGERVGDKDMQALSEPIRQAIDGLGSEAVALGLISRESYEKNRGTYLHRVYEKHEFENGHVGRWAEKFMGGRRRKIVGNQFKGRGIFEDVPRARIMKDNAEFNAGMRGALVKGEEITILELRESTGTDSFQEVPGAKGRLVRRVYWPTNKPIPASLDNYENRGTFDVRGVTGDKVTLWRDFTKAERTKMGEVLDARYTIAKTYSLMSKDLATGRFFKDIAENEDWSRAEPPENERVDMEPTEGSFLKRMWATDSVKWVLVPDTKISKSQAYKYGALAGRYVRASIWRDLAEQQAMASPSFYNKLLTQWKLNKTARSPVVHMNNIMSNFLFMDMADVRVPELIAGIRSMANGDAAYNEAAQAGAFGADMVTQELRDTILRPLLLELQKDMQGGKTGLEAQFGTLGKIMSRLGGMIKTADEKMVNAYQMEDQVFRMATYIRRRQQGMTVNEAAVEARDQFLNYDIRAPWVNAARRTVLPFASYTYRAIPKIAETIAQRPWKIAKYIAIYQSLNMLAYALAPSEWDEEEERKSLRKEEGGKIGFLGIPVTESLLRMPYLSDGNPVFLDVRRWIPAGDVFDTRGGDLPAPLHMGGPLITGMELYFNRSAFTGDDIVNPIVDTASERAGKRAKFLWQSVVPSAPWVPGSWYFEKIKRAVFDDALQWGSNEPYDPLEAILSSVGIKLKPKDVELGYRGWMMDYQRTERELAFSLSSLKRQYARQQIGLEAFEREYQKVIDKRVRLRQERTQRLD